MRKAIFGLVLGMLFLTLAFGLTEYNNPASVAQAPPDKIDVTQALSNGNGEAITQAQWLYGDNLEKGDNLALYPNAQRALEQKHGLSVDLSAGQITYDNGKLTNGEITLDFNSPQYKGAIIKALKGGGFSISKGSSEGKFEYDGNEIDFAKSTGNVETNGEMVLPSVEIKPNGEIILPKDATMKDETGNEITAIQDGLTVKEEGSTTTLVGVGKVKTPGGTGYVGLGEKGGTLKLTTSLCSGTTCFKFSGNNYLIEPLVGSSTSGDWKANGLTTPVLDDEMKQNLQELSTKALQSESLERSEVQIHRELISHFPEPLTTEISSKLAAERRALTSLNGHTSTLSLVKSENGVILKPQQFGVISTPVETKSPEPFSPKVFIEGTSTATLLDYFTIAPNGNFEAEFSPGYKQTVRMRGNIDGSNIKAIYEMFISEEIGKALGGGDLIASVTIHSGAGGIGEQFSGTVAVGTKN